LFDFPQNIHSTVQSGEAGTFLIEEGSDEKDKAEKVREGGREGGREGRREGAREEMLKKIHS